MNHRISSRQQTIKSICFITILYIANFCIPAYGQITKSKNIKVALIYTVTTPELKEDVVREITNQLGKDIDFLTYEVPEVFNEILETGYVTAIPAARMIATYMKAVEEEADAILSICSTVEDVAYSAQDIARYLGVPIVMVNEEMCREAVRKGSKIAIMSTFPTSIEPTKNTLQRVSREIGKPIEIFEVLVEGGFGLAQEQLKSLMAEKAKGIASQVDVIIFSQGSMAYCEEYLENMYHKEIISNPYFSAKALKEALIKKGKRLSVVFLLDKEGNTFISQSDMLIYSTFTDR